MRLNKKLGENTILHYVVAENTGYDENYNQTIEQYSLSFQFYDSYYTVYVDNNELEDEYPFLQMEGDSELFSSFERLCEDEYWDIIRQSCKE